MQQGPAGSSRRAAALWGAALLIGAMSSPCRAGAQPPPADPPLEREPADAEPRVRAGYLARFGGFVQWPSQAFASVDAPLVIGLLEADAVADDLAALAARHMPQGRVITVRRLRAGEPLAGVHVLFIGPPVNGRLAEVLSAVRGAPVLTVTEHADALTAGSILNLAVVDGRLRFEVSLKAAAKAGLVISARLLSVASRVEPLP